MRKVLSFALLLAVAGCATPARWEKAGVNAEMTATDAVECRRSASQEAFLYESGLPPAPRPYGRGYLRQYQDSERFYAENRLVAFCMRAKGYEQVPIPRQPG